MAKKKNRQQDPNDSSDSGDQNAGSSATVCGCKHLNKAIQLGVVKKKLKGGIRTSCDMCAKKSKHSNIVPDVSLSNEEEVIDDNWSYWMCLACAHVGCGRSQYKHAMAHWKTPRSETHDVIVDIETWIVWCYTCEQKMAPNSTKKLQECVEYIRRHMQSTKPMAVVSEDPPSSVQSEASVMAPASEKNATADTVNQKSTQSEVNNSSSISKKVAKPSKVRGLMNLGNTCFYNSVLQCLSVTPYLIKILEKLTRSGESFTLPGDLKTDIYEAPEVHGSLGESGPLSNALLSTLLEMRSPDLHADVLRPQKLLKQVQDAFPQFRGHEQHDAHELLRHLLEGVRSDDLKRFQRVILEKHGLLRRKNDEVAADMKKRMKLYGQQLQEFILGVEGIFKGQLVSIVECQDCKHHSTRFESFLDLSLPVMEDKPLPPMRKKEQAELLFGTDSGPSKHQLKKQKKAAKRHYRSQKSRRNEKMDGCLTILEENLKGSGPESEQSDADVEDNVEQEAASSNGKEVAESGYSSDKQHTGESGGTSPSIPTANGDAEAVQDADPTSAVPTSPAVSASLTASASPSPTASASPSVPESPTAPVSSDGPSPPPSPPPSPSPSPSPSPRSAGPVSQVADWPEAEARCFTPVDGDEELRITIPASGEGSIHISPVLPSDRPMSRRGFFPGDSHPAGVAPHFTPDLETRLLSLCLKENGEASQVRDAEFGGQGHEGPDGACNNTVKHAADMIENNRKVEAWREGQMEHSNEISEDLTQFKHNSSNEGFPFAIKELNECKFTEYKTNVQLSKTVDQGATGVEISSKAGDTAETDKNEVSGWCKTLAPRQQSEEGECSIISCLNQFTSIELMTGNNKVGCEACTQRQNRDSEGKTVYTNSTKQFLISSPPPVLILHLKRFMMENFRFKKLQRYVSFPLDLDIAPFCSSKCKASSSFQEMQPEVQYSLFALVEHTGSLNTGHYIAYIKIRSSLGEQDPRWSFLPKTREFVYPKVNLCANSSFRETYEMEEKWYSISDSRVVEIAEAKVLKLQAYLLFYERIM